MWFRWWLWDAGELPTLWHLQGMQVCPGIEVVSDAAACICSREAESVVQDRLIAGAICRTLVMCCAGYLTQQQKLHAGAFECCV